MERKESLCPKNITAQFDDTGANNRDLQDVQFTFTLFFQSHLSAVNLIRVLPISFQKINKFCIAPFWVAHLKEQSQPVEQSIILGFRDHKILNTLIGPTKAASLITFSHSHTCILRTSTVTNFP